MGKVLKVFLARNLALLGNEGLTIRHDANPNNEHKRACMSLKVVTPI